MDSSGFFLMEVMVVIQSHSCSRIGFAVFSVGAISSYFLTRSDLNTTQKVVCSIISVAALIFTFKRLNKISQIRNLWNARELLKLPSTKRVLKESDSHACQIAKKYDKKGFGTELVSRIRQVHQLGVLSRGGHDEIAAALISYGMSGGISTHNDIV